MPACGSLGAGMKGNGGLFSSLSGVGAVHIDYHRPASPEKQDDLLTVGPRGIDVTMNCPRRDEEEISRADGNGIASTRPSLEARVSRDHVAVDIVVPVVMPTGYDTRIDPRPNYLKAFPVKSHVPGDTCAPGCF